MARIKPNIDAINRVDNMVELQKIKSSLQTQQIDNLIKQDKESSVIISTLLRGVEEREKLLSNPEYLRDVARLQREQLAANGQELQKMFDELNLSFGGRKIKKSIRKSAKKSVGKKRKSVRKSVRKTKKSVRKSKKIKKSVKKSPRKIKKSVRKSIRKVKARH